MYSNVFIPREARFTISSRAKRACITQASQGQRDFLLAINLSSLVGVRLDVIQSSDVKAHYGFPGNRLPSSQQRWIQQVAGNRRWERLTNKTPQEREHRL